jgi:hypothetical protein
MNTLTNIISIVKAVIACASVNNIFGPPRLLLIFDKGGGGEYFDDVGVGVLAVY